jgi:hypothetical protein
MGRKFIVVENMGDIKYYVERVAFLYDFGGLRSNLAPHLHRTNPCDAYNGGCICNRQRNSY